MEDALEAGALRAEDREGEGGIAREERLPGVAVQGASPVNHVLHLSGAETQFWGCTWYGSQILWRK